MLYSHAMEGTYINVLAIIVGSSIGLLINKNIPQRFVSVFFQVIGLFTIILGITMAIKSTHLLHVVMALISGVIIGELFRLQDNMEHLGDFLRKKLKIGNEKFTEGLVTSFLLYCIGSLTIVGAIEAGINDDHKLIYIKSLMDGVSSIALASGLGIGVMFSVFPLFIFQGGITILAMYFGDFFPQVMITELSAVGGVILVGLGINILEIKKLSVLNMLPALVTIIILLLILPDISAIFQ